jgi:hypothetical protein
LVLAICAFVSVLAQAMRLVAEDYSEDQKGGDYGRL